MSVKKLTVNTLVYAIGPQLPQFISLLMLPVLTPHLTGKDYGVYGTLMAYYAALVALKDLGFTSILSVSFYKYPEKYRFIWNKLFAVISIWSVPLAAILAFVIYLVLPAEESENFICIAFLQCSPLVLFSPTKWIGRKYFQLIQKPVPIVVFNGIASLFGIVTNYFTISVWKMGYMGWFIGGFVISFITFIPYLWLIKGKLKLKFDIKINSKWLKRYLAVGLPVLPHYYSSYLLDASDRVLLSWYKIPFEEIGYYSLAYSVGGYFAIVGNALGEASGPMYIKLFKSETIRDEVKARNLTFVMQGVTMTLAFLGAIWMKEFFEILIKNDSLQIAYTMAVLIIMSYSYRPIYFGPIAKLQYLLQTKELWKISLVAGIINIMLNLILIPVFGVWGSVISTFIAFMTMGFRGYFLKAYRQNNPVNYYPQVWFILIVLTTFLAFAIKDISIISKLSITIALTGLSFYILFKNKNNLEF